MAIPTKIPKQIRAGDTLTFTNTWSDYPADEWTLTYTIVNSTDRYTFTASADGEDYTVTVAATSTGNWDAGDYVYFAKVSKSGEVYTVETGDCEILLSYSTAVETRSYAKIMLDAIEDTLVGKVTKDAQIYTIAGRSITKMNLAELLAARDRFKAEYAQELRLQKINRGENATTNLKVRF